MNINLCWTHPKKNLRFEMYKEMPFFHMLFIQEFETLWNIYLE